MKLATLLSLSLVVFSLSIPVHSQTPPSVFRAKAQSHSIVTPADSDCVNQTCSSSSDVTWTTTGVPDTRPGTWGTTDTSIFSYTFTNVPSGYRVQVLRTYGDNVAWIQGNPQSNSHAGVLFSMSSSTGNSSDVTNGNSSCFLYHEGALSSNGTLTDPFDNVTADGGVLGSDNTIQVKLAMFLNDTGAAVFQDVTFVVVYRFVVPVVPVN